MTKKIPIYLRYCLGLPRFLRQPLSPEKCCALVRERVETRAVNFLAVLKSAVYPFPKNPYRRLLHFARCELGDIEEMVSRDGLEETLRKLSEAGVYITIDEYKEKRPVERSGLSFEVKPEDFDNPCIFSSLEFASGGTRSRGISTYLSWDFLTDEAALEGVVLDALGLRGAPYAIWHDVLKRLLTLVKAGEPPLKWFLPVTTNRNRLASYYAVWAGRQLGYPLAWPERTGPNDAKKVALWLSEETRVRSRSVLNASPSNALRVSLAAKGQGLNLSGVHMITGGEPLSSGKERQIKACGATLSSQYSAVETGYMGLGCGSSGAGAVHLLKSKVALIQANGPVGATGISVDKFRVTTLAPTAPKIFINMENGDYGTLETRPCGCKLDALGLADHLGQIRSFEKLTSEGMTFFAGDLARIIEEILPEKFGGGPFDYQAIEEEGEDGATQITFFVSRRLGPVNEDALLKTVYKELAEGGSNSQRMAAVWSEAGSIKVKRADPQPNKAGKIIPFQVR